MIVASTHLAGLPQLDVHTLSEDWALVTALQAHWAILAAETGLPPGRWFDSAGDRMYGAVVALSTRFDCTLEEVAPTRENVSFKLPRVLADTAA